jgi:hypothetical protein
LRGQEALKLVASDDDDLATFALTNAQRRTELNPAVASIVATAAHVSGLLESSPEDLEVATNLFEPGRRRLEYASALEDLGVNRAATNRDAGVDALSRALAEYVGSGRHGTPAEYAGDSAS